MTLDPKDINEFCTDDARNVVTIHGASDSLFIADTIVQSVIGKLAVANNLNKDSIRFSEMVSIGLTELRRNLAEAEKPEINKPECEALTKLHSDKRMLLLRSEYYVSIFRKWLMDTFENNDELKLIINRLNLVHAEISGIWDAVDRLTNKDTTVHPDTDIVKRELTNIVEIINDSNDMINSQCKLAMLLINDTRKSESLEQDLENIGHYVRYMTDYINDINSGIIAIPYKLQIFRGRDKLNCHEEIYIETTENIDRYENIEDFLNKIVELGLITERQANYVVNVEKIYSINK